MIGEKIEKVSRYVILYSAYNNKKKKKKKKKKKNHKDYITILCKEGSYRKICDNDCIRQMRYSKYIILLIFSERIRPLTIKTFLE